MVGPCSQRQASGTNPVSIATTRYSKVVLDGKNEFIEEAEPEHR